MNSIAYRDPPISTSAPRLLVVDDDQRILRYLNNYLESEGCHVTMASTGAELRRLLDHEPIDLIILDVMLGSESGFDIAREIRRASNIPIIMLSGKSDVVDCVVGLELGADDYVTKPFEERELLARIRNALRRSTLTMTTNAAHQGPRAKFAGLQLNFATHELTAEDGSEIHLTGREYLMLAAFIQNANQVLSRDKLMENVVGRDYTPFDRSIDVTIGKLRRKIETDPDHPKIIKTVRNAGYKFVADVAYL